MIGVGAVRRPRSVSRISRIRRLLLIVVAILILITTTDTIVNIILLRGWTYWITPLISHLAGIRIVISIHILGRWWHRRCIATILSIFGSSWARTPLLPSLPIWVNRRHSSTLLCKAYLLRLTPCSSLRRLSHWRRHRNLSIRRNVKRLRIHRIMMLWPTRRSPTVVHHLLYLTMLLCQPTLIHKYR